VGWCARLLGLSFSSFLVAQGISEELFEEFCEMLPKVFRVSSTRNLTSRQRTHSFK